MRTIVHLKLSVAKAILVREGRWLHHVLLVLLPEREHLVICIRGLIGDRSILVVADTVVSLDLSVGLHAR